VALMTAAEVREAYIIGLSGTDEDAALDKLITRADELFARWCFYPSAPGVAPTMEDITYTDFIDAPMVNQPQALLLRAGPVVSITTAEIDDLGTWTYDTAIPSGDRTLDGSRRILYTNPLAADSWLTGLRANKVVYVAGYATATPALKHAVGVQVAQWWRLRRERGKSSVSSRGSNINLLPETISDEAQQALSDFRLIGNSVG
jgi:hypothetical protein